VNTEALLTYKQVVANCSSVDFLRLQERTSYPTEVSRDLLQSLEANVRIIVQIMGRQLASTSSYCRYIVRATVSNVGQTILINTYSLIKLLGVGEVKSAWNLLAYCTSLG
jgi:hypothetical protein